MTRSTVPESIEDAPKSIQGCFPGLWWNENRDLARWDRIEEIKEQVSDSDVVGVVDSDADGLACDVVLREKYDNPTVIVAGSSEYGISFTQALNVLSETVNNTPVFVADLSPNDSFSSFLASLAKLDTEVRIFDHHNWTWSSQTSVRNVVDELVIEDDKCAAQVLQENIYPDADDQLTEFLEVTADHDLWIKEDDRSDYLSTLSFALPRDEYVQNAQEYGANMIKKSDHLSNVYHKIKKETEQMAQIAINRADFFDVNDTTVALTYFDCHQSQVGDTLIEDYGVDLAVIIQPTAHLSFRSTPEFGRCAELARDLGGNGHEDAAGASIYSEMNIDLETVNTEDLLIPEIGEEDVDPDSLNDIEALWRLRGQPAIDAVEDYLKQSL